MYRTKSQFIGRSPFKRPQKITIGDWEEDIKPIAREILHVLGKVNEHTRADRDNYTTIDWSQIQPGTYMYMCISILHTVKVQ